MDKSLRYEPTCFTTAYREDIELSYEHIRLQSDACKLRFELPKLAIVFPLLKIGLLIKPK